MIISNQIANSRPIEVIQKYKELRRKSLRDEQTLSQLESRKLFLLLENERKRSLGTHNRTYII